MASEKVTAKDMMAVAKDKLAAKAGFRDGATAKAHYEPLLNRDLAGDAPETRQSPYDNKPPPKRVKPQLYFGKRLALYHVGIHTVDEIS
ncbi:hypothetical protein F4802DRAFT_594652 [Xylaria palmicola]|nr:hypothetical protein F4802DRAFT_594652 [Xylaria palmicola]